MRFGMMVISLFIIYFGAPAYAADPPVLEDIIEAAYQRDSTQREAIEDLTVSAVSYARKLSGGGDTKEEKKFTKTYYFKNSLFKAVFHDYYKNGELQTKKELAGEIKEAQKRREKGRSRDASVRPLLAFYPDQRRGYDFKFLGVKTKGGYECYVVEAVSKTQDEDILEGKFWIETGEFNLVYTEFHPAKLPGPIKQLDMQMTYAPVKDDLWLMEHFYMYGRGKVMIFIKFYFEVEELYSDYRINTGLDEAIFEEVNDENQDL